MSKRIAAQSVNEALGDLDPRVARLKARMLSAPYEVCMARAKHFTDAYRETEGMDAALRNAAALQRTLTKQKIFIYPDERLAGSKTERYLAGPLSVERGDFLRTLQLEMDILHRKTKPFLISEEDRRLFWEEILPYWDGRTLRDYKAREWRERGIVDVDESIIGQVRRQYGAVKFLRYIGRDSLNKLLGANRGASLSRRRIRNLHSLRNEFSYNNPTAAIYCFDVQGHLSLGVDKVVKSGMAAIIARARKRLEKLERDAPDDMRGVAFLNAVIQSLEAAIQYSERFAALAEKMAAEAADKPEQDRLKRIAAACRRVPRLKPRTFHEAVQAAWMAHVVGEIQYGTHDVFAPGRIDQFLYPYYRRDIDEGRMTHDLAIALLQEYFLKLSANVEPIPEVGMETNAVLGNSQHCVTIGGLTPAGEDGTNELSYLILDAFEQMNGTVNQVCVRIHKHSPPDFLKRSAAVFRKTNGLAIYNDAAIVTALQADGMSVEDARDYDIVGCVETSGQSDTHGCPGGHELVLPAVLLLTLSGGRFPPPVMGQMRGYDSGDPRGFATYDLLLEAFNRQLGRQIELLTEAAAGKDTAYREMLPAPYVSALMDGCLESARDITDGGAKYDFTSVDLRGLATLVDSLLAIKRLVYERGEFRLPEFLGIMEKNFEGHETLRRRIFLEGPKYGRGEEEGDRLALDVLDRVHAEISKYKNIRGGSFRACYYSYGNHVIDGFFLGATPDGRRRGEPISNGASPSDLIEQKGGPLGGMKTISKFPPEKISSGVSLNVRFHPSFIHSERGLDSFAGMIRTYFDMGGMHIQPNVISTETLRDAQLHPEKYRGLVVKVAGYSAYFTDLGESIQQDIINRCEFGG